ncbi:MAG TPA: putative manganese-dependent inorganic diphosphatase [Solirubrobacteraceae bacterium]|nr:putative manganese-dependent inorganic diphosphatase [Solirubrobacteraceae bacterium]
MATIYVTGHRNPDTDSIASAIGYAELRRRLDPNNDYVPVRLGDTNPQTNWLLERSGAPEPRFLPHVLVRACDVMHSDFPVVGQDEPIRQAGIALSRAELELVPVVDDGGALTGVVTERALARRYIRESRHTSTLRDAPTYVHAIVEVLDGELLTGDDDLLEGRVWVHAMDVATPSGISDGDVVVVGNRDDSQKLAIDLGAALLVLSNDARPSDEVLELARGRGVAVAVSPLDSYVSGRMITLAAPCRALMERDPLSITTEFLLADVAEQVRESHYGAAVVVDANRRPVGLVTRSDLVSPMRRRVILVDHAEQAQSVAGIDQAEIVEILDHHHIGSIETRVPVTATFDPVGSTATLVVERFRQNGMEPSRATATMLLGAVLSDTVILNSATTTERDRAVVEYLERVLAVDASEIGREMFEATSDVSELTAEQIVSRDAKQYQVSSGNTICIAQIEVVGDALLDRKNELLEAMRKARESRDLELYALMVTDVLTKGTELLVVGDTATVARSFGVKPHDSQIELPGVMSRKKEVAPKLLAAL